VKNFLLKHFYWICQYATTIIYYTRNHERTTIKTNPSLRIATIWGSSLYRLQSTGGIVDIRVYIAITTISCRYNHGQRLYYSRYICVIMYFYSSLFAVLFFKIYNVLNNNIINLALDIVMHLVCAFL